MPLDANDQDLDPSTDPNLDDQQVLPEAQAAAEPAEGANSSPATGEEDKSMLDVVRDVVDKSKAKSEPASPAEGEDDGDQGDKQTKKQDDENYEDVPFHKHPRFQHLLRKSKTFEQDAIRYQNVQNFLDQNGLSSEEASDALVTASLAKTNPAECWRQIKPWVQNLLIAAGEVLPDDLQKRVEAGEMTAAAALEVSRSNAAVQSMRAAQSFREQQNERSQQREAASAVTGAAQSWEAERRARDPNFDAKVEPLMKEVAWLQAKEGKPSTPEGVKEQLQKAYKAVNAAFVAPKPAPAPAARPAVKPVTGGAVAGKAQPATMSTLDIVRANRRGAA